MQPLAPEILLGVVGDGLDAGFRTMNGTVDLVILVGETRKMRIRCLQIVNAIGLIGKLFGQFVRDVAHRVLLLV